MDGRTNGQMDGQTENLPILQDFVPYRGRCQTLTLTPTLNPSPPYPLTAGEGRGMFLNAAVDNKTPTLTPNLTQTLTPTSNLTLTPILNPSLPYPLPAGEGRGMFLNASTVFSLREKPVEVKDCSPTLSLRERAGECS